MIETIKNNICKVFEVREDELTGKSKESRVIFAKHLFRKYLTDNMTERKSALKANCSVGSVHKSKVVYEDIYQTDKSFREKADSILKSYL
jgi:chromosomal replication initiation ATPase DnaA